MDSTVSDAKEKSSETLDSEQPEKSEVPDEPVTHNGSEVQGKKEADTDKETVPADGPPTDKRLRDSSTSKNVESSETAKSAQKTDDNEKKEKSGTKQETHSRNIRDVYNIGNLAGGLNISAGDSSTADRPEDPPFVDPTIPLPDRGSTLSEFDDFEELDIYAKQLIAERILVINCLDAEVAEAAARGLVEKTDPSDVYEKRWLAFDRNNVYRSDLSLNIFLDHKIGGGKKMIVLISLKSQKFIESMFMERTSARYVSEQLEASETMLVCIGDMDMKQTAQTGSKYDYCFSQWSLPFLPYMLRPHFAREEAEHLNRQIQDQRKSGLWDQNGDEREFYHKIANHLAAGAEDFKKTMKEQDGPNKHGDRHEGTIQIRSRLPQDFIKDAEPLHNTVIYIAAFFPGLSPFEFSNMVVLLLSDKQISLVEESQVIDHREEIKTIKAKVEKRLVDIWEENPDKIMRDCLLQTLREKNHAATVGFSPLLSRTSCKTYFELAFPMFLRQQFSRIQESGILFDPDAGEAVIENVIRLSAEMAVSDPAYYGKDWLFGLVVGLKQHLNAEVEPSGYVEQLIQLLNDIKSKQIRKHFCARLSQLLREMLNHPSLNDMVLNFLDDLIQAKYSDIALEIVVEISDQLQFTPHFDPLFWLQRFLNQGNAETREGAYIALLRLARMRGFRIFEILETMRSWLPDVSKDPDRYAFSEKYALAFIIHYCITLRYVEDIYGQWPSRYPLLATLKNDEATRLHGARLELIIEWLFHPGLNTIFLDLTDNLIANLLEEWATILYGFDQNDAHPEAIGLCDAMLRKIVQVAEDTRQKALIRIWQNKPRFYLDIMNQLRRKGRDDEKYLKERGRLLRRRSIVHDLVSQFKKYQQQSDT